MGINISCDEQGVIRVSGDVNHSNVGQLNSALDAMATEFPDGFTVDFTDTYYIDSAGVQAIFSAYQKAVLKNHGTLTLILGNPNIREVLSVVNLDNLPGLVLHDSMPPERESK